MNVSTRILSFLMLIGLLLPTHAAASGSTVKNVLFIGDSTTGWLADRLNAYGNINGFSVAAEVWDGSTIKKWAESPRTAKAIATQKPDVIFVSLGMNDMYVTNPEKRLGSSLNKLLKTFGDIPVIWIGPVSWPGKNLGNQVNAWLSSRLGAWHYFDSSTLKLTRQSKTNPHPTREATAQWLDSVLGWLKTSGAVSLPGYANPGKRAMLRPKAFHYRRFSKK